MLEQPSIIPEKKNRPYFDQPSSSKEFSAAKRFLENYVDKGVFTTELSESNIDLIREEIVKLGKRLFPGAEPEGVLVELRNAGAIAPSVTEKIKTEKPIDFIKTDYVTLEKPKQVEMTEEQLQVLEANLLLEEVKKANIFKNDEELDALYRKSIESDTSSLEHEEYYYEFVSAGLIKGGEQEVHEDLAYLAYLKEKFEQNTQEKTQDQERVERAKKLATITERGLAEGVTKHKWYGENVIISPASEFDDVRHGVDDILEIKNEDEESSFMGLGIDVTFRGLESEQFKQKFFKLLQSIRDGYKTKVKYGRNYKGQPLREFAIPKMVLYFNIGDVKDMADIIKFADDESKKDVFQNSAQKFNVIRQIINSCKKLSMFAEESQNSIFRKYNAVLSSFKELSWENPEIQEMLELDQDDEISKKLDELIVEFRAEETQRLLNAA